MKVVVGPSASVDPTVLYTSTDIGNRDGIYKPSEIPAARIVVANGVRIYKATDGNIFPWKPENWTKYTFVEVRESISITFDNTVRGKS